MPVNRRKNSSENRGGARSHRARRPRGRSGAMTAGWLFLGAALMLAVVVLVLLLPGRNAKGSSGPEATPLPPADGPGSAFQTEETAPPLVHAQGTGGRAVDVRAVRCDFSAPESLTVGVLRSADLSGLADAVAENAGASGWGEVTWTVTNSGELLLRSKAQTPLTADAFARQEAFLTTAQPENLARTFLENSGLIPLLRGYGLTLSTAAENSDGMITFRGTGDAPQTECSVRFSFLYTGAFNQAVVRAVYLDGAVTTSDVVPLKTAIKGAVTWNSADLGGVDVTACEIRPIRGIPFYVLTCSDGTVAYALAVKESALSQVPGAAELYREMMSEGIQEYQEVPGAGY